MLYSQHNRLGIARFLLGLYIAVLTNGIVFRHAHRLADGTIITHAHPYKSSPNSQFPQHSHSNQELAWLDAFTNALYASPNAVTWIVLALVIALLTIGFVYTDCHFFSSHIAFRHRGPPVGLV